MEITDFLSIGVVGLVASLSLEWFKTFLGLTSLGSKFLTVLMAVILGSVYVLITNSPYQETILLVLSSASTIYTFLLKDSVVAKKIQETASGDYDD